MATLQDLSSMTHEQLVAFAMAQQQKQANRGTVIKVYGKGVKRINPKGETVVGKGNVAVYGLQRMPVTLYPKQWQALLGMAKEILATIEANKDSLSWDKDSED